MIEERTEKTEQPLQTRSAFVYSCLQWHAWWEKTWCASATPGWELLFSGREIKIKSTAFSASWYIQKQKAQNDQ